MRWSRRDRLRRGGSRGQPQPTASSFHLWWSLPRSSRRLVEVSATLEVLEAPTVPSLYFWALQVGFVDSAGRRLGAAHTGLQWHPAAPGGAVNWGGYHEGGHELDGSASALPPIDSANTLRWPWAPGRPYRLRVHAPTAGTWRAEIEDPVAGGHQVLRDLHVDAAALADPVCWSEVFAPCEAPAVTIRWSGLSAIDEGGATVAPTELRPTYQDLAAGGCANTESCADAAGGVVQAAGLARPRSRRSSDTIAYRERSPG